VADPTNGHVGTFTVPNDPVVHPPNVTGRWRGVLRSRASEARGAGQLSLGGTEAACCSARRAHPGDGRATASTR